MVVLLVMAVVVIMVEVVACTRISVHCRYVLEILLDAQYTLILILNNTQNTTLPKSAYF